MTHITPQTATLAEYLNADLQRIANSANQRLHMLRQANMTARARQAEEQQVIKLARQAALLRVESTVRQIRNRPLEQRLEALDAAERTTSALRSATQSRTEDLSTGPLKDGSTEELVTKPLKDKPTEELSTRQLTGAADGSTTEVPTTVLAAEPTDALDATDRTPTPNREDSTAEVTARTESMLAVPEFHGDRLQRLLRFVARQQPELRWAIGDLEDGRTLLVTDLAQGWIPPGITVPTGVRLLEPGRRDGNLAALLGPAVRAQTYSPGDRLGPATDLGILGACDQARELPEIEDLGWLLGTATHWRDGLPRLVHTLAKAGVAGTGVADSEMDLLRVHGDTTLYELLAQYPDIDNAVLLNCLLVAATEGIASDDLIAANYHFAWFQALSAPPESSWDATPD